jgi:hypothetical protein
MNGRSDKTGTTKVLNIDEHESHEPCSKHYGEGGQLYIFISNVVTYSFNLSKGEDSVAKKKNWTDIEKEIKNFQKKMKQFWEELKSDIHCKPSTVEIDVIVDQLKQAIDYANDELKKDQLLPPMKSAEIVLKLTYAGELGFVLPTLASLLYLTAKFGIKRTHVSETHIVFVPRPLPKKLPDIPDQIDTIKQIIVEVGSKIKNLKIESASVELDFTITEEGEIGFIIYGNEQMEGTHSLIITFKKEDSPVGKAGKDK